jgi:hypothetical protein
MKRNSYRWQRIMDEALKYRVLCWRYGAEPEDVLERLESSNKTNNSKPHEFRWLEARSV